MSKQMKLESIHIENLRAIKDQTVSLEDYTAFIGPNGAGKSTVLFALNVFFQEAQAGSTSAKALSVEDFHKQNTKDPIRITVTFGGLSDEAKEEFKHYFRADKLIITTQAVFDPSRGTVLVEQKGQRLVIADFGTYFEADRDGKLVADLRSIYQAIKTKYTDLTSETTKGGMEAALRSYEEAHPEQCTLEESSAQFYGISKGTNKLEKFLQWVYVPAVKEATTEQQEGKDTALGKVLDRTIRASISFGETIDEIKSNALKSYAQMLSDNKKALGELEAKLTERLTEFAHPDCGLTLEWSQDPSKSINVTEPLALAKVHEFGLDPHLLGRCGHGLQRSFLLALLRILAGADEKGAPTMILGIEEAELFQHPPQARHLASVLKRLADGNSQVVLTTHCPYFVSAEDFEAVRLTRRDGKEKETVFAWASFEDVSKIEAAATGNAPLKPVGVRAKLAPELRRGLSEMFFTRALVLVEGVSDAAYIESHAVIHGYWDDFRKGGVIVLPVHNKCNLIRPAAIASKLQIPNLVVYDSDGQETRADRRKKHEDDNLALQKQKDMPKLEPFPTVHMFSSGLIAWTNKIEDAICDEAPAKEYSEAKSEAERQNGQPGELNKNPMFIASLLAELNDRGFRSKLLDKVCEAIIGITA